MKNFEGFGLSSTLMASLARMEYSKPTPIQAQAIPLALKGRDIMGTAQTGTGKTAAFAIPLIEHLMTNPRGAALVLTPTRELGKQIMDIMHQLIGRDSSIKTAFIIGGESMGKQLKQLQARPRLIVGTPGRINDHLQRGTMMLNETDFLVLDETDRMLDMGFTIQLEKIFKYMPQKRQTLMFSATLPKDILRMSSQYMDNPERIAIGETNVVAVNIKQEVIRIEQDKKYAELTDQLYDRSGSVIVFVKTKHGCDRMAKNLRRDGFTSEALHGDLRQNKRDKVMRNFRQQNFRVLIATDIAARGLDVPHIEHVINYDLPQVAEDYIHRMGRTARAGAEGSAISFVSNQDGRKWHAIEMLLDPDKASNDRGSKSRKGRPRRHGKHNDRFKGNKSKRGKRSFGDNRNDQGEQRNHKPFKAKGGHRSDDGHRSDRTDRSNRFEKSSDRPQRSNKSDRPVKAGRFDNADQTDKPNKFEKKKRYDHKRDGGHKKDFKRGPRQDRNDNRGDRDGNRSEGRQFEGKRSGSKPPMRKGKSYGKPSGGAGKSYGKRDGSGFKGGQRNNSRGGSKGGFNKGGNFKGKGHSSRRNGGRDRNAA